MYDAFRDQLPDIDPDETKEWLESLDQVIDASPARARSSCHRILLHARPSAADRASGDGLDQLHQHDLARGGALLPRQRGIELQIRQIIRWNAAVMVLAGQQESSTGSADTSRPTRRRRLCTRSASTTSSAARTPPAGETRSSSRATARPGIYARAVPRGPPHRGAARELPARSVRRRPFVVPAPPPDAELLGVPDRVDGALAAERDLPGSLQPLPHHRGIKDTSQQRVWAFTGDGEMDEPESMAALSLAAREGLDNLIFVVNCNLQRLDGPVRGNGKIIQELESHVPRGRLARDQGGLGAASGTTCSPAITTGSSSTR